MSYEVDYKKYCEGHSVESLLKTKKRVTAEIERRKASLKKPIHYRTGKPLAQATIVHYETELRGDQRFLEAIEKTISEQEAI